MLVRTISAIVVLTIFLPAFIWSDTVIFVVALSFLSGLSIFELLKCTNHLKKFTVSIPAMVSAVLMPFAIRYGGKFDEDFLNCNAYILLISISLLLFFAVVTSLVMARKEVNVHESISTAAVSMYIILGFSSILMLRDSENGAYLYLMPFLTAWGSDIFAYFVGKFCGKHKLAPRVSPKKTIEGSIGGIFGNILFFAVYAFVLSKTVNVQPNYIAIVIIAVITSVIAQIGDLFMSLIKRHYGIKDFGKILPGHGGALDRFDSLIAVAPFLYLLCVSNTFLKLF